MWNGSFRATWICNVQVGMTLDPTAAGARWRPSVCAIEETGDWVEKKRNQIRLIRSNRWIIKGLMMFE